MNSSAIAFAVKSSSHALLDVRLRKPYAAHGESRFQLEAEFQASPGVTVLLGPSGAGKSTLLRCIAGLCHPEQGRIAIGSTIFFDTDQKINVDTARRNVAFVFQNLALFPHLTVEENVGYGLRRLDRRERRQKVDAILESFQILRLRKRAPREISGGEQQRVALARSLVMEPSVLLLDEPLSSLDMRTKASIIDDLRSWNQARQIPVLYVTHNHEELFALGERVIALEAGRIVAQGSPREVVSAPRHEVHTRHDDFENLFEGTIIGIQSAEKTMTCRLARTSIELEVPLARVALGETIQLGIRRKKNKMTAWQRLFVFVCTHNISRSPMAHAICNAEIASRLGIPMESLAELGIQAISAGLAPTPGTPMATEAEAALREIGISLSRHRSRKLDPAVVHQAQAIYCMTEEQRHEAIAMFPEAASKIHRLHPLEDIENPTGEGPGAFRNVANLLRAAIRQRLGNLGNLQTTEIS